MSARRSADVRLFELPKRRDEAHGSLGKCGDGQAGIYAKVGGDDRSIADIHVPVTEDPVPRVDNAAIGLVYVWRKGALEWK